MEGNSDLNGLPTIAGVVPQIQKTSKDRAGESTSLSPNKNQTYFANEKIKIPERESVSFIF